ncbi:hypothetical protein SASPL_122015 [Salvia splendens]|uniref:DEAD/DEAH-box helicase domain-containing protein n=1 Tax=Salvia splendens TaxID=180675 RepID=A0A8X8ZRN6_SALSN|nr:hypothetical protein SASPL_122015 [Salvia splendens]
MVTGGYCRVESSGEEIEGSFPKLPKSPLRFMKKLGSAPTKLVVAPINMQVPVVCCASSLRELGRGVNILVATPGRLAVDLLERERVSLQMIRCLALDEADRIVGSSSYLIVQRVAYVLVMASLLLLLIVTGLNRPLSGLMQEANQDILAWLSHLAARSSYGKSSRR